MLGEEYKLHIPAEFPAEVRLVTPLILRWWNVTSWAVSPQDHGS